MWTPIKNTGKKAGVHFCVPLLCPTDRRADIWAFGCVVYEMLAGRVAFAGETTSDVLASVIRAEPDWSLLPGSVPACIRDLPPRCLEKDPRQRLQSIGDARIIIEETIAGKIPYELPAGAPGPGPAPIPIGRRAIPWIIASALAVTRAIVLFTGRWSPPAPEAPLRASLLPPKDAQFRPYGFALSPDGRKIAFVAYAPAEQKENLWVRPLDSTSAFPLAGTDNATYAFWSPDSKSIGFFADAKLKRVDASGGSVITVADAPVARGGAWGKDGSIIFAAQLGG